MRLHLGSRIRTYRKQSNLSQADLAKKVGISASYLNLIEHNKRAVAGKLLSELASQLGVKLSQLTRGITTDMVERFQQAARRFAPNQLEQPAELDQIEELVAHYPGWTLLLDQHIQELEETEKLTELLSDRMSHDPFLSDTLHIMLSNITAIRSSAELIVMQGNMTEEQRNKFSRNIFVESKRLSSTAQKLLLHFESKLSVQEQNLTAQDQQTARPLTDALNPASPPPDNPVVAPAMLPQSIIADQAFDTVRLAITPASLDASKNHHQFDPFIISTYFKSPMRLTFYRLLELAAADGLPDFGILEIDNASGVLFRQEIPGFRLPSRSGACPRWPIYRALSAAQHPVSARMILNSGEKYLAYAFTFQQPKTHSYLPPVSKSLMIFHQEIGHFKSTDPSLPEIEAGFHCSVCSRTECEDRREGYALTAEPR